MKRYALICEWDDYESGNSYTLELDNKSEEQLLEWVSSQHGREFVGYLDRPWGNKVFKEVYDEWEREKEESSRWTYLRTTPKFDVYEYQHPTKGKIIRRRKRNILAEMTADVYLPRIKDLIFKPNPLTQWVEKKSGEETL